MTSPVDKVTWLQIVTILLVISKTSLAFAIPDHRENIQNTSTLDTTSLRNDSIFRISSESQHRHTAADGTSTPATTTSQRDTSHSETTTTTTAIQSSSERIATSTNAHQRTTTNNYVSSSHLNSRTLSSTTTPVPISQQQQQQRQQQPQQPQQLHHSIEQTTDSTKSVSPQYKTEPEFTTSDLPIDLQKDLHRRELDIRNSIKETFVTLTKDVHVSPYFMFSLFLDLFDHFERTSAETANADLLTNNGEDVTEGFDDVGDTAAAYDDDDNDFYSHYNHDFDDIESEFGSYADEQRSEISSENENPENESESGFAETKFEHLDFDIHVNFNRLLRNLVEHFSKHQTHVNEEGHRIFLDFIYKLIHHYFDQLSRTEHHRFQDHHQESPLDGYHGIKESYEQLNDKVRMQFGHLIESIQSNHRRHGHASVPEIPKLEIFEDMHLLLSKIINVEEAGDSELNHCIDKCINGWQHRKTVNKKYSGVSENFFKSKNISRENWDELLVAIQSSTANLTKEVRECKYPIPEVHQISQYRYVLPENNSQTEYNTPISGGQREGKIIPDHVELHRCRHRYGCCNHYDNHQDVTRRCAAKNWTVVERVHEEVIVEVVDEEEKTKSIPRFYKFINETECHCKVVSKRNYNCTSSFEFLDEDANNMNCACNRHSTSYSTCKEISNGLRKLSDSDLRCIRLKECLIPSCVHGTFDFDSGLCPKNAAQRSTKSSLRDTT